MTAPDTTAIRGLKSKRSKCADVGNLDLSNVPESHETIWLQWGDNGGDDDTWCADNINDEDAPYIRADLVFALCDALDKLRADNERLRAALRPFAAAADDYCDPAYHDDYSPQWAEFFVVRDFRRARGALGQEGDA